MKEPEITLTTQRRIILTLVYRFRFVTTKHIQQALGLKYLANVQPRVNFLVEHGLIGRNYTGAHRLAGIPASYYMLPKGLKALKQFDPDVSKSALHNAYYDKSAKERFIRHCLLVGDINLELTHLHGDKLEFFTKSESKELDYFPDPLPDAYIAIVDGTRADSDTEHFFLEVCEDSTPSFVFKKRIAAYTEYAEEGKWQEETESKLPTILLVCESDGLRRRLQWFAHVELENSFEEDLRFKVITKEQIPSLTDSKNKARKS